MSPDEAPTAERLAGLVQLTLVLTRMPCIVAATRYETRAIGYEVHRIFPARDKLFYQGVWVGETPSTPPHAQRGRDDVRECASPNELACVVALRFVDALALQLADAVVQRAGGDPDLVALLRDLVGYLDMAACPPGKALGALLRYEDMFAPGDWDCSGAAWTESAAGEGLSL